MSNHDTTPKTKTIHTSAFDDQENQELGKTLTPPKFSLTAGDEDGNPRDSQITKDGSIKFTPRQRIEKLLNSDIEESEIAKVLVQLYAMTIVEIAELWADERTAAKIPTFVSSLTTQHVLAFPREIAATLQVLPNRQEKISEILRNRLDHYREKMTKMEELEVAQVTFLLQGLGADAFANPEEKAAYLAGLQEHSDFASALRDDIKNDLKAEEELGSDFTSNRAHIQKEIASKVAKIIAINENWGELDITSNIQPEEAIKIVEILRGVEDNVRKEMLRRYSNDIYYVVFNLPHQYREQLNFGLDPERGKGEKSPSFVLEQLAMPQTGRPQPLKPTVWTFFWESRFKEVFRPNAKQPLKQIFRRKRSGSIYQFWKRCFSFSQRVKRSLLAKHLKSPFLQENRETIKICLTIMVLSPAAGSSRQKLKMAPISPSKALHWVPTKNVAKQESATSPTIKNRSRRQKQLPRRKERNSIKRRLIPSLHVPREWANSSTLLY